MQPVSAKDLLVYPDKTPINLVRGKIIEQRDPFQLQEDFKESFKILIDQTPFDLLFYNKNPKFQGTNYVGQFVVVRATPSQRDKKLCGVKKTIWQNERGEVFHQISCTYKGEMEIVGGQTQPTNQGGQGDRGQEQQRSENRWNQQGTQGQAPSQSARQVRVKYKTPEEAQNDLRSFFPTVVQTMNLHRLSFARACDLATEYAEQAGVPMPPEFIQSMTATLFIEMKNKGGIVAMPDKENVLEVLAEMKQNSGSQSRG